MKRITLLLFAVAIVAGVVAALAQISTGAGAKSDAQSARDIRGASKHDHCRSWQNTTFGPPCARKLIMRRVLTRTATHYSGMILDFLHLNATHDVPLTQARCNKLVTNPQSF